MTLYQHNLFGEPAGAAATIVNVASVPQRSPFRYPGGKTWLVPRFRRWMQSLPRRPAHLIEPFAGGASLGLTAAFEDFADHVTLVERDDDVAAVWQTILDGGAGGLAAQIMTLPRTVEAVEAVLNQPPRTTGERAFQTLLRNRINHGGILAPGVGRLRHGENGRGIWSRWYPETLVARILAIERIADKLTILHGDGLRVLEKHAPEADTVFFIDPPYTAAGKKAGTRLYRHSELDHTRLFALCAVLRGDFLMTYDNTPEVEELALRQGFSTRAIAMKNTHHAAMTERLIGKNLDWSHD